MCAAEGAFTALGPVVIASVAGDIAEVLFGVLVIAAIVVGVIAATAAGKRLDLRVIGDVYSDVRGDEPFAVVAIGDGIKVTKVDDMEFREYGADLRLFQWLILRPGRHVVTVDFKSSTSSYVGFGVTATNSITLRELLAKELDLVAGSTHRLSALIDGRWQSAAEMDVFTTMWTLPSPHQNSTIEIRLVDCPSRAAAFAERIAAHVALHRPPRTGMPVPNCFLPAEARAAAPAEPCKAAPSAEGAQPAAPDWSEIITCDECGKGNPKNGTRCMNCGNELRQP